MEAIKVALTLQTCQSTIHLDHISKYYDAATRKGGLMWTGQGGNTEEQLQPNRKKQVTINLDVYHFRKHLDR